MLLQSLSSDLLLNVVQAAQLRVENSSLLKRLTDMNQKYNEAAVDNRVLKADIETLRAKVTLAQDKSRFTQVLVQDEAMM